jgi:hypothetical protein
MTVASNCKTESEGTSDSRDDDEDDDADADADMLFDRVRRRAPFSPVRRSLVRKQAAGKQQR